MKKLSLFVAGIILIVFSSCTQAKKETTINAMSFNLRLDTPIDSLNNWQYRKNVAAQIILQKNIDVVGVQEALHNMMEDLESAMPEYTAIGVGREDGKEKGEYSAIFYKTKKFTEKKSGTFWLSETPDVPGSMGWDAACTRVATWVVLEDNETKENFFFVNTHLDHIGVKARQNGVHLMIEKAMKEANGLPFIITGDFNASPDSNVIQYVKNQENPKILMAREIAKEKHDKKGTFHDFGKIAEGEREYIDFIFVSEGCTVLYYEAIDDKLNDIYLSDHNPIWAKITLKQK